ncbi:MAG: histidinol dehydrogenase [Woeseiaceae bacterium]|nr:histidinol dehydrogenase [Woeseiaceae bacterium]
MNTALADTRIVQWRMTDDGERARLLARPAVQQDNTIRDAVNRILRQVRERGDDALLDLTEQFDRVRLTSLRVGNDEFDAAEKALSTTAINAIEVAIRNVRRFHEAQAVPDIRVETMPGVVCERVSRPIDAVGLYVPAGSAPLPSAAIMLTIPAAIAGCPRRVLCTPPRRDGTADPAVLAAARRGGIDEVFKVGGAQAIAALAYGTKSINAVDKIFGPGNAFVTAAKATVANDPGGAAIDLPAGPSEVMVIADAGANPDYVAADLLSQAEHGSDSQVLLVTTSDQLASDVLIAVDRQLMRLDRHAIAASALQHSRIIVTDSIDTALGICNAYAPEHLILQIDNPRSVLPAVRNAGSVFLGPWTPESVGDYCSGTNHVLPTYGAARSYSGLGVEQFMRNMTVQELTRDGLHALAPTAVELASLEGLDAHAEAVRIRLGEDGGTGG